MAADDFLNAPDQGFPGDLDTASPYSGNRPASGARRATPGEVLSSGFHGDQNAGDFLGLDVEFTANQSTGFEGTPLDLVPPPGTYADPAQEGDDSSVVPEPAPMPEGDAAQEFAQAPSAFEFGEDLGSDDGEFAAAESAPASKAAALFAGVGVALLAAAAVFFGPGLYARFFPKPSEVATKPETPARRPGPAASPDAAPAAAESAPEISRPSPTPDEPVAPLTAASEAPVEPLTKPGRPESTRWVEPSPSSDDSGTPLVEEPVTTSATRPVGPQAFPDLGGPEYEWASSDQLELIWRGSEVPLEALHAPAKTIMPRVGNVRVIMGTGDVFEGRLYAVGQGRVWIDTDPGRVGLDGEKVARIDVLPPLPEGTRPTAGGAETGGRRVRVQAPGGMLYGRVVKAEGSEVILALDEGGRVRVQGSDVQDLGSGRAIVVRR